MLILLIILLMGLGDARLIAVSSPPTFSRILQLSGNTLFMSAFAGLLATAYAFGCVLLMQKLGRRLGFLVPALAIFPVFVSPPVMAIVAVHLLGPSGWLSGFITNSELTFPVVERVRSDAPNLPSAPIFTLWGGGLTLAWALYPFALLFLHRAMQLLPRDQKDAASLEGNRFQVFFRITLRGMLPALAVSWSMVTFLSMMEFGIPEALRSLPVLVSEVYVQAGVFFDLRNATLAGLVLVLLGAVVLLPTIFFFGDTLDSDSPTVVQKSFRTSGLSPLLSAIILIPAIAILVVLWVTAAGPNGRVGVWTAALSTAYEEIFKSFLMSLLAVIPILICGFFLGLGLSASRARLFGRVLCLLPFLTPSPLLALSLQQLLRLPSRYDIPVLDDLFFNFAQSHGPLLIVWILRFAPIVALFVDGILRYRLSRETQMLMRLEPVKSWRLIPSVYLPLAIPALLVSSLLVFGLCISEVGAAVLLMPPGITNLGVRLLTQMHYAPSGQISALALLMILPGAMVCGVIGLGWKRIMAWSVD